MKKNFLGMLLALTLLASASVLAQSSTSVATQKAHDDAAAAARAATQSGGLLDGMVGSKGKAMMPAGALTAPANTNAPPGVVDDQIANCYIYSRPGQGGLQGQALSDACEPAIQGAGVSSNGTGTAAQLLAATCDPDGNGLINPAITKGTNLYTRCTTIVAVKKGSVAILDARQKLGDGSTIGVTSTDKTKPGISDNDIKNSYSDCTSENQQVSPPTMQEEICTSERATTTGNACAKTLTTDVKWSCPAGAISGPTRVLPGTVSHDHIPDTPGTYTCQVQVPRNVYSCPTGTMGPANLAVPPSTTPEQACTRTVDGVVIAATLTVVQDEVTKPATYTVTDSWAGNCAGYEANTPADLRDSSAAVTSSMDAFNSSAGDQRCRVAGSSCGDPSTGSRLINDVPVARACWQYSESFDCLTTTVVESCDDKPKCTWIPDSYTCLEPQDKNIPQSECPEYQRRRSCEIAPAVTRDVTSCDKQTYCPGGTCWDTGYKANTEFGSAVSYFAGAQQGGRYFNANDLQIFKGYPSACSQRMGLILNCCKKNVLGNLIFDATHIADKLRPGGDSGSSDAQLFNDKTYDFLFAKDSTGQMAAGLRAIGTMTGAANDVYNDIKNQDFKKAAKQLFYTTPSKLAKQAGNFAVDALVRFATLDGVIDGCSEDDNMTQQKKEKNLCVEFNAVCTSHVPIVGWCLTREHRSCCYNSLLAKLINDQGRAQLVQKQADKTLNPADLARSLFSADATNASQRFGTGDTPNCLGFSLDQLKALDFSKIDLSPFLATINAKIPNKADLIARLKTSYADCPGGTAQCDGQTPESKAVDTDSSKVAVDEETRMPAMKQYLSLKPLLRQAYWTNQVVGPAAINAVDWRQLPNYRFHNGEPPVTATVAPYGPLPGKPGCKTMGVYITRARVQQTWDEHRVPKYDDAGTGTIVGWTETGKIPRAQNADNYNNGGIKELPTAYRGMKDLPETKAYYTINYCHDGSIPGVTP